MKGLKNNFIHSATDFTEIFLPFINLVWNWMERLFLDFYWYLLFGRKRQAAASSEAAARRPTRPTGQFPTVPSCAEAQHQALFFSSSTVQRRILVVIQSFRETLCSVGFEVEQKRFLHHQKWKMSRRKKFNLLAYLQSFQMNWKGYLIKVMKWKSCGFAGFRWGARLSLTAAAPLPQLCVASLPQSYANCSNRRAQINIYKHWTEIPSAASSRRPLISSQTAKWHTS